MMWLQCQEEYDCIAKFDRKDGSIKKYSRKDLVNKSSEIKDINGWFSELRDGFFVLYKTSDNIYFRVYNHEFILDDNTVVEVFGPREKRELQVKRNSQLIFETKYVLKQPGKIPNDPTPFIDEEDFDFGFFMSNISKNPERKSVLLGKD